MPRSLLAILLFISFESAWAKASQMQGLFGVGMVSGSFSGAEAGSFSVPMSVEGVGEYMLTPKDSLFVRATVALDQTTGQFKYVYMGTGQRFYFFSRGQSLENFQEGNLIQIIPKRRFFVNYDVGLSHIQVKRVTDSLTVESTLLDFGATIGYIHQVSKRIGVSGTVGYSKGFPLSPVAVDSSILRAMLGLTSFF